MIYTIFRRGVYVDFIYTIYSSYDITTLSVYVCIYIYIHVYMNIRTCFMQCIDFRMFFIVLLYYLVSNDYIKMFNQSVTQKWFYMYECFFIGTKSHLIHWSRVTHICVSELTIIGSDNGLSPGRRQVIIWNNAGLLFIRPSGTNFSEILIAIDVFSFKKMHLNMSSGQCRPFCLGLNVLNGSINRFGPVTHCRMRDVAVILN